MAAQRVTANAPVVGSIHGQGNLLILAQVRKLFILVQYVLSSAS